jgi:hypothetical protein
MIQILHVLGSNFTGHDVRYTNNNDVILANGITIHRIYTEKSKIIDKVANKQ